MLDTHTNRTGRFEIEKKNISKSLAVYQKFRVRSHPDNLINDRVLISQIKQYDSGGSSQPQATVFLDRAPTCAIYSYKKEFKDFINFIEEEDEGEISILATKEIINDDNQNFVKNYLSFVNNPKDDALFYNIANKVKMSLIESLAKK